MYRLCIFLFLGACCFTCKVKEKAGTKNLDNDLLWILDKENGGKAVTSDTMDGFFDKITLMDMGIQMKEDLSGVNREEAVTKYKKHLKAGILDFTEVEKKELNALFAKAKAILDQVNVDIYDEPIELIKTNENHYGSGVYYTRQRSIIIPKNSLLEVKSPRFYQTMLHEIFHIYSRYNPEKRNELYALVGFTPVKGEIIFPPQLASQILLNPDGTDHRYSITLTEKGVKHKVIPLIFSKQTYNPKITSFFRYLNFQLFEIKLGKNGFAVLPNSGKGTSFTEMEDFWKQIKENTDYIIHPDEILADNFSMLFYAKENPDSIEKLTLEGKKLLQNVENILKK